MELSESDPRFGIGKSTIPGAGLGLFARAALAQGDRLEVIGVLVPADSVSDACTSYADRYKFRVGDRLLIPVGYASLVNHSLESNFEKMIEDDRLYLRALRAIRPGEELFFCYSEYAQAQFAEETRR